MNRIKQRILTEDNLRELVELVNEELDATSCENRERLDAVVAEITDVQRRLGRLYDAIETGKVEINDLAPRIQALRHQEDQLEAARLDMEESLAQRRIKLADAEVVRSYADNLRDVLSKSPLMEQKAFIRSFVKEIKVTGKEVLLTYTVPLSPDGISQGMAEVLDTVGCGRARGTRTHNPLIKSQ